MKALPTDFINEHMRQYPAQKPIIEAFAKDFIATWASARRAYNTEVSIYFLRPYPELKALFGFDRELILAIPHFNDIQPRTMQAIESFLGDEPALGRVDQTLFLVYSVDPSARQWIAEYRMQNPQSRIPVVFTPGDLSPENEDPWHIKNAISRQLYISNFFAYTLPLNNDLFRLDEKI